MLMKTGIQIALFILILIILSLIFYSINLDKELRKKNLIIQNLTVGKTELQNKIASFEIFLQNLSEAKEAELTIQIS